MASVEREIPPDGFQGIIRHRKSDLIAAFSVALVAMPLALGIAVASGVPPMAGLLAAIVGGIVTTFVRGSHVAINGPAAGLIVVILAAIEALRDPSGKALPYVMAAIVVAGAIQVFLGLSRLGGLGNFFPSSVIHGMLAGIGVIIAVKQIDHALGSTPHGAHSALENLLAVPHSLMDLNPFITTIAAVSLAVLIFYPKLKSRSIQFIPAPVWVLFFSIPLVYLFDMFRPRQEAAFGKLYELGPQFLVRIPDSILEALILPDFSKIGEPVFWIAVLSICLVATIETLASAKAVDELDAYKRKTDLSRDLVGVGLSTMVSGALGGLPIITVIVRSSVNVNHGAKTRWSNFYHGLILLAFVLLCPGLIGQVPLAALAAILIYTGCKLASPRVFREALRHGNEQLIILCVTLACTLHFGLLEGIGAGLLCALLLHWVWSGMSPGSFARSILRPDFRLETSLTGTHHVKLRGVVNYVNLFWLDRLVRGLPRGEDVVLDLAHAKLVDPIALEYLGEFGEQYLRDGGHYDTVGLDLHTSSSDHPRALRRLRSPIQERNNGPLFGRSKKLQALVEREGWSFDPSVNWSPGASQDFHFFDTRRIEFELNVIHGQYEDLGIEWEVKDITFDEGTFLATEEHHMTVQLLHLPFDVPVFALEKEALVDRFLHLAGHREVDFISYRDMSREFVVRAPEQEELRDFLTPEILHFLETEELYHLESDGKALLVFKYDRLAGQRDIKTMIRFCHDLLILIDKAMDTRDQNRLSGLGPLSSVGR